MHDGWFYRHNGFYGLILLICTNNNHWHKIKVSIVNGASGSNVIEKKEVQRGPNRMFPNICFPISIILQNVCSHIESLRQTTDA
jgi:hypothetical protein